jgi:hypothetical protein
MVQGAKQAVAHILAIGCARNGTGARSGLRRIIIVDLDLGDQAFVDYVILP